MNDVNNVILEGRLVRDPQLSYSTKGLAVCSFVIANNTYKKIGEEWEQQPNYIPIVAFQELAEQVKLEKEKGAKCRVQGTLKQSSWTDLNGEKHNRIFVVAREIR